ncbi:MAG: MgtC/SapB family protein [Tepidimonas sp.]
MVDSVAMTEVSGAARTLAAALGCGLLVGLERERRKGHGATRVFAGIRTFALVCVLGAAAALTGSAGLVPVGALLVAGLAAVSHWRDRSPDPGATTEIALFLTYLIGVLCAWSLPLAAAVAVGLTGVLAARERLHRFARQWLRPYEVRDGIILAAIVLIALPLMPDRTVAGEGRAGARLMAGAGLLSCVATLLQMAVIAAALQPAWLAWLWLPTLVGVTLALGLGLWLVQGALAGTNAGAPAPVDGAQAQRMFSLRNAAVVAGVLTLVQVGVHGLGRWLGPVAESAGTLLASLFDLHAALAAIFVQGTPPASGTPDRLVWTLALALLVHAASKSAVAWASGGRDYARWLVPMLWLHTLPVVALILWTPVRAG